jgi:hypothetical protein
MPPARRCGTLVASHPFGFLDYFRVPYDVVPAAGDGLAPSLGALATASADVPQRTLLWVRTDAHQAPAEADHRIARFRVHGSTVAGHLWCAPPPSQSSPTGGAWRELEPIHDSDGRRVSAVWIDGRGTVFLPFDPGEVMQFLWSERYTRVGKAGRWRLARAVAIRAYYAVRPMMPRRLQLRLRRSVAHRQAPPAWPAWPVEPGLHDLYDWLFGLCSDVAGGPLPWVDLWPDGRLWALVLTHDVETAEGVQDLELLRADERRRGFRSSWNFVPLRYDVDPSVLDRLKEEGCEVGVHGLRHDGRDLASRRLLKRRLPAIRAYAERWGAVGFRSPATQRSWDLMPRLGFEYDSSYTDTDPYEPQPGGCCTWLPFFNGATVELPITLPQDHTLFEILGHADGTLWRDKASYIRARGGMVLVLSHPDYAGDDRAARAWRELLSEFEQDLTVWQALPCEVAEWWRSRAASRVVRSGDGWDVEGPAAGRARVRLTGAGALLQERAQ